MAEEANDDPWLDQLRAALAGAVDPRSEDDRSKREIDWAKIEPAPEGPAEPFHGEVDDPGPAPAPQPAPAPPAAAPAPAPSPSDTSLILDTLAQVTRELARVVERVDAFEASSREASAPVEVQAPGFDQAELDRVVADAIRASMMKAQATGAGTTRLETEVRVLEETVSRLSKRVGELNITALARDRLEKDVHVERLAEAAEEVGRRIEQATALQRTFDQNIDKLLDRARDGEGESVAWTDVMLLAHELRSRVDDLEEQQRRVLRDLEDWQGEISDRFSSFRGEVLDALREGRGEAGPV